MTTELPLTSYSFIARIAGGDRNVTAFRKHGRAWTIKPMIGGRPRWVSLQVSGQSKEDLALLRKRAALKIGELIEQQFAPEPKREIEAPPLASTIGATIDAYLARIAIETKIDPKSAGDNARRLLLILREVHQIDKDAGRELPLTALTRELVETFQDNRLSEVRDAVAQGRARRTADQTVNMARGLFTDAAMNVYRKAGLHIPDLTGFKTAPRKGNWNSAAYVPIPDKTIKAMNKASVEELRAKQPKVYLTYLLMLRCGLRNSEAEHARRVWIEKQGKAAFLAVIARPGWPGPKNGRDRRIPIAPDVLAEIEALAGPDYLLGGTANQRYEITHIAVCDFVRRFLPGLDDDPDGGRVKAAYELRKHFGAMIASTQSLDRAAEYLGDRIDTTERHYHAWLKTRTARPLMANELTASRGRAVRETKLGSRRESPARVARSKR